MKVLIAGGGTGGHVYPALAIAEEIRQNYPKSTIEFAGKDNCMEKDLVPKAGFKLNNIRIYGFERYYSFPMKVKTFFKMFKGLKDANNLIKTYKPDIVIGTGGFVSGPVVLCANLNKIPTLIHEQNALPGFTTKTLSRFANRVCISFENTKEYVKYPNRAFLTGNPVRSEFTSINKKDARDKLKINENSFVILSFGGSLGAKNINEAMKYVMSKLNSGENIMIYHVTGNSHYDEFIESLDEKIKNSKNINIIKYAYDMPTLLNASDLVISRSGAMSIAEITLLGKMGIFIPYPYASDDHQRKNAEELVKKDAGIMILDSDISGEILYKEVKKAIDDTEYVKKTGENAKKMSNPNSKKLILEQINLVLGLKNK